MNEIQGVPVESMSVDVFYGLYDVIDRRGWRIVGMLTEEAGEVQGAFNKWQSGKLGFPQHSPKTEKDVKTELTQLLACVYAAGIHFDIPPSALIQDAIRFAAEKIRFIHSSGERM